VYVVLWYNIINLFMIVNVRNYL